MPPTAPPLFVDVHLEPCAAAPDGISMRFKRTVDAAPRSVHEVSYESEDGVDGVWRVVAIDSDAANDASPATVIAIEDSSEGTVLLVTGGAAGLRLEHAATGAVAREPYLVLAMGSAIR